MANTLTINYKSYGIKDTILYATLASDGSEESDTVIYDSSAVATALGITDTLTCTLRWIKVYAAVSNGAAGTFRGKLEFDATTDVLAFSIPSGNGAAEADFTCTGGLKNYAGTGVTGDITLTTLGLDAGDSLIIEMSVSPK